MRLIKFVTNWLLIATVPVWGGLLLFGVILWDTLEVVTGLRKKENASFWDVASGQRFLWDN